MMMRSFVSPQQNPDRTLKLLSVFVRSLCRIVGANTRLLPRNISLLLELATIRSLIVGEMDVRNRRQISDLKKPLR